MRQARERTLRFCGLSNVRSLRPSPVVHLAQTNWREYRLRFFLQNCHNTSEKRFRYAGISGSNYGVRVSKSARQPAIGPATVSMQYCEGLRWKSDSSRSLRSPQKVNRLNRRQVFWLGGRQLRAGPFTFPGEIPSGFSNGLTLTHSGGTAPALHRTSLLGPCGLLRILSMREQPDVCK